MLKKYLVSNVANVTSLLTLDFNQFPAWRRRSRRRAREGGARSPTLAPFLFSTEQFDLSAKSVKSQLYFNATTQISIIWFHNIEDVSVQQNI